MSGEATKEHVTPVPSKSKLLTFWKCTMHVMRSEMQGIRCLQRTAESLSGWF